MKELTIAPPLGVTGRAAVASKSTDKAIAHAKPAGARQGLLPTAQAVCGVWEACEGSVLLSAALLDTFPTSAQRMEQSNRLRGNFTVQVVSVQT